MCGPSLGAPTLMSDLALQDLLLGRLATKDELAAQSWARLNARDDGFAAQVRLGAITLMSDLAPQDLHGGLDIKDELAAQSWA